MQVLKNVTHHTPCLLFKTQSKEKPYIRIRFVYVFLLKIGHLQPGAGLYLSDLPIVYSAAMEMMLFTLQLGPKWYLRNEACEFPFVIRIQ